jgi:class 3 adenylate cyclase
MSNALPQETQDALLAAGLEPIDPNSDDADDADELGTHISVEGPTNDQELTVLLGDAVTFAQTMDSVEAGPYEERAFTFRRLSTGKYVCMTHRS